MGYCLWCGVLFTHLWKNGSYLQISSRESRMPTTFKTKRIKLRILAKSEGSLDSFCGFLPWNHQWQVLMRAAPHKPTDGVPWLIQLPLLVQQSQDTIWEDFGKHCKVGAFDLTSIKTVRNRIFCNLWCFLLCLTQLSNPCRFNKNA